MTFKDLKVGDTLYYILQDKEELSICKNIITNIEIKDGHMFIFYGLVRNYIPIPFNHLSSSKVKTDGKYVFLSKKALRKYYNQQLEKFIRSE